jgi:hypothetical protein
MPARPWKYRDWLTYVIENKGRVFKSGKGKMLKVFYVHSNDNAKEKLLTDASSRKQGDFTVITMKYRESVSKRSKKTEYWMHEKEPGLLMFFTVSTNDAYDKTLRAKIDEIHGLHEMWIKPDAFEGIRKHLVVAKKCGIVKFLAERKHGDATPEQVKESAERHVQYRTTNPQDGVLRLEEMKYDLGVRPISIEYSLDTNRFQITEEGMFHLKSVSKISFDLMDEVIEKIREEEKSMRDIAQGLKFEPELIDEIESRGNIVESGKLTLDRELDVEAANQIIKQFKRFTFINPRIEAGSLIFSSTVIDRQKGSVFALSATENNIILIPRYKSTFESFLLFYKDVVEQIDSKAILSKFS